MSYKFYGVEVNTDVAGDIVEIKDSEGKVIACTVFKGDIEIATNEVTVQLNNYRILNKEDK